jgi:hypothetical protein
MIRLRRTGNLTGYDDGVTSAVYGYDEAYRKTDETVNYSPFTLTNRYAYYKNGLKKRFTGPDNIDKAISTTTTTSSPACRSSTCADATSNATIVFFFKTRLLYRK